MWSFIPASKIDSKIKSYIKSEYRRKLPVVISYKENKSRVKSKIQSAGGKIRYEYEYVNAIACDISPSSADKISDLPEVSFICIDYKAQLCMHTARYACETKALNPLSLTGHGIGIGLLDTGVFPHPDLTTPRNCICFFKDLIGSFEHPYDDHGHGTFMAGCICSSGISSDGKERGIAPGADLCAIKCFDSTGHGYMSDIIMGIDVLIGVSEKYNIRVICLPFEFPYIDNLKSNPLNDIILKCIDKGIAVVVSAGNHGPQPCSVYFPGSIKEVITVGGANCTGKNEKSYKVSQFSGRGPTLSGFVKPDMCAPAVNISSLSCDTSYVPSIRVKPRLSCFYEARSGTSISAAIAAGICAVILQKSPELTPKDLKSVLCISCISLGESRYTQGCGLFTFKRIDEL